METSFPLRDGYFGPLQYSNEELARWKRLVVELVERTLQDEQPVFASNYERVDSQGWKLIKTKDQLRIHQPRSGSIEAVTAKSPCVLAVGTIEGTLEDVIYGIHNTTTRDIRVTRAFLSDKSLDSAVLHVFENGTHDDPYRSLALKWRAVETPAGSLVKNRDGCVLEYMGIDYDGNGHRYAFQVSENIDHPICPPFTAEGVVRADVHIRAIYRELDAGRVGVFFYAGYDMSGQIPKFLASWTAASVAFAVGKSVECAEAKRLTALALSDLNVTLRQKNRYMQRRLSSMPMCSICCTSPTYLSSFASRSALAECPICTAVMCSKCSSKKFLLSEHSKLRVNCCKQCIVAARSLNVNPRRPLQLVSFPAWVSRSEIAADGASNRHVAKQSLSPLDQRRIIAGLPATGASAYDDDEPTDEMSPPRDPAGWPSAAIVRASVIWGHGRESSHSSNAPTRRCSSEPHDESPTELWMRMMELRTAAEQTYRITKEVDRLMAPERERLGRRDRRVRAP